MPVKMHQVFYFIALSEEQSFTRPAKRCGVAQPSLTRGIKTLEKEFGARLFERSKSNVRLTQLGLLVRPDFERVSQATTFLAQRITELKAASPSKPSATAMEAPMRAPVLAVTTIALILLGLAFHPTPSATTGAPEQARAQMDPYALQSVDGVKSLPTQQTSDPY
ncbi:MAG: LysR family transcriptional regulator [Pseudolabrys sp.]|jgi:hypothetical protein